ncbi:MAG: regulatory protein RecX [Phycisphaerales bacterium]|nr:regulatory protein RecX [Phycisphaerales bacterium]
MAYSKRLPPQVNLKRLKNDGSETITGLPSCRDDPARVTVIVSSKRIGRILIETKTKHRLTKGMRWSSELRDALYEELTRQNALRSAVRMLTLSARSRVDLERSLIGRSHPREAAVWAVERMDAMGAIDDELFAAGLVRRELVRKPAGRRLLESKLRAKGVSDDIAQRVIDEALGERDPYEDAMKIATRAVRAMGDSLEREKKYRRLTGKLARRGFDADVVRRAVEAALRECD